MTNKKTIAIVGGGFCGMMTAVHLIRQNQPANIIIINDGYAFGRGVAYSAHTDKYLLNVRAINMSAFDNERFHFLDWLHQQPSYNHVPKNILANVYATRKIYGDYLEQIWLDAVKHKNPCIDIHIMHQQAANVYEAPSALHIGLENKETITADMVVLATGNTAPRHVTAQSKQFVSNKYFANPWTKQCVNNVKHLKNILIAGNGLTMVDTLQGLVENGFKGKIYTLSPNGFKLIPHKYNLLVYDKIIEELPAEYSLKELFFIIRKHIKSMNDVGIGSHLVIDALRPYTQQIWQSFSLEEKRSFVRRLSHAWTILRHRLPMHIFEMIQDMRMKNKLITISGRIKDIAEKASALTVTYYNNTTKETDTINVDRVINCTGPESDVNRSSNQLIRHLAGQGLITADELKLGIKADAKTGAVINSDGEVSNKIYTIGGNLKGILWESTAIPDIRLQTQSLAAHIAQTLKEKIAINGN